MVYSAGVHKPWKLALDSRRGEESEDSPIYFPGFFLDMRVRVFALELLANVWKPMEDLQPERLLQIYENLQSKRRKVVGTVRMERTFTTQDILQLSEAVRNVPTG